MDAFRSPAPKVDRDAVAFVMHQPAAVIVLDLETGRIYPDTARRGASDPFESPTLLVLVTHDDAMHHAKDARGNLGRITRLLNLELYALAARGEIPTSAEVAAVLAELEHIEAEVLQFRSA